jgi:hypothetical protein
VFTLLPEDFNQQFLNGTLPLFDAMVTFSSLEHTGLGRYRDFLNPWGDLISMAKSWCVLKPKGQVLLGVPVYAEDQLMVNLGMRRASVTQALRKRYASAGKTPGKRQASAGQALDNCRASTG